MSGGITTHVVREADARDLSGIETESVHMILTNPPHVTRLVPLDN